jgi:serine/threonine protein kinase
MGVVYRAFDSRLGRHVAIKQSAERFSDRFEREARAVAALNHPNICHLYDVGPDYLVMELVEGETLAERIKQGALDLEDALNVARQIAEALEAAHEKGIIHRDLKPGNIKITPDGGVKVLDFGLAKIADTIMASPGLKPADSPTLTLEAATRIGAVMGTAGYMAPEQARGKSVDKRADIWAFGVVLHELLTGERAFGGETISDTLAAVLKEEPNLDRVPAKVHRLLRSCLEKDPKKRLRDIGDAWRLLDDRQASAPSASARKLPWAVAALLAAALAAAVWAPWRSQPPIQPIRFALHRSEGSRLIMATLSPDGRSIALISAIGDSNESVLSIRSLDSLETRAMAGTEGAINAYWSPDSRWIVLAVGGKLKKVAASGGRPQTLCDLPRRGGNSGSSWNRDGVILFSAGVLMRISEAGGMPTPVTAIDPSAANREHHGRPFFLPDGRHFLYARNTDDPVTTGTYVGDLTAKPEMQATHRLLDSSFSAVYVPPRAGGPGHLLFLREDTLVAQPFDVDRLELQGEPASIAEDISHNESTFAAFSASTNGVLAFRTGQRGNSRYLWYDRSGKPLGPASDPGTYFEMNLAPDGSRAALGPAGSNDIWLLDFARASQTRFTSHAAPDRSPVWSPDGGQIVFTSIREGGTLDLYSKPSNGAREETPLLQMPGGEYPQDWSTDGRSLLVTHRPEGASVSDLYVLPIESGTNGSTLTAGKPTPYLATPFNEIQSKFSPDGRWVVYTSDESGTPEIYVRPFPDALSGKWTISTGGGVQARWRRDGKEIVYLGRDGLMAVEVKSAGNALKAGVPKKLFNPLMRGGPFRVSPGHLWDMTADGRLLVNTPSDTSIASPFTVIVNWQAHLKP